MADALQSFELQPGLAPAARAASRALALSVTIARLLVEARAEGETSPTICAGRAQRTARAILYGHGVDVRSYGPVPRDPVLLVANHVSYLDPLVVSALVPCVSIAKGETREWPLIGPGLRALGVVFVRRGDAYSGALALRRAWRALRSGTTVLNFPEGTTGDGRIVGSFQRGAFGLARLARVPVVPLRIDYDDDRVPWFGGQTFAPHYWRLAGTSRVVARVRFAEPLPANDGDDPSRLATRARDVVHALQAR
jgi:1-acyl-sn-glycerol-3-phosphate acyltransferase